MTEKDIKMVKACIEHEDYYSAMKYSTLIKDAYEDERKHFFEQIISNVKSGNYEKIKELIKMC